MVWGCRRELLRGPLYYGIVLLTATIVYWRNSPIGVTAVAVMASGDGFADLVGRRYGSAKLPHNPRKSWAGSLAMLIGTWLLNVQSLDHQIQAVTSSEMKIWFCPESCSQIYLYGRIFLEKPAAAEELSRGNSTCSGVS